MSGLCMQTFTLIRYFSSNMYWLKGPAGISRHVEKVHFWTEVSMYRRPRIFIRTQACRTSFKQVVNKIIRCRALSGHTLNPILLAVRFQSVALEHFAFDKLVLIELSILYLFFLVGRDGKATKTIQTQCPFNFVMDWLCIYVGISTYIHIQSWSLQLVSSSTFSPLVGVSDCWCCTASN